MQAVRLSNVCSDAEEDAEAVGYSTGSGSNRGLVSGGFDSRGRTFCVYYFEPCRTIFILQSLAQYQVYIH